MCTSYNIRSLPIYFRYHELMATVDNPQTDFDVTLDTAGTYTLCYKTDPTNSSSAFIPQSTVTVQARDRMYSRLRPPLPYPPPDDNATPFSDGGDGYQSRPYRDTAVPAHGCKTHSGEHRR